MPPRLIQYSRLHAALTRLRSLRREQEDILQRFPDLGEVGRPGRAKRRRAARVTTRKTPLSVGGFTPGVH
jgi:hypothetical protein